jgi:hypothetical protein
MTLPSERGRHLPSTCQRVRTPRRGGMDTDWPEMPGKTGRGEVTDDPFTTPGHVIPPRVPRPGELLFEFVRASDGAPMRCELRFHGESLGGEAQFFERGEFWYSRGAFVLRRLAIQWAEVERKAME